MAWTVDSSGSQSATISTEHILASPTTIATYVFSVDTINMVNGDAVELRAYDKVDGTNYREVFKLTYQHDQGERNAKVFPPLAVTAQAKFTLKQTAGTGRAFPWSVRRI